MKANNWLNITLMLVAGILMIVWHSRIDILQWIVVAVGIVLIVPSIYSFIAALTRKRSARLAHEESESSEIVRHEGLSAGNSSLWTAVAAAALGIWMLCDPSFFVGLLAYVFGAILVLYGIYHIVVISYMSRPVRMPWWFYLIPVLMILAGLTLMFTTVRTLNNVIVLITGISFVASSVNSILEGVVISSAESARRQSDV